MKKIVQMCLLSTTLVLFSCGNNNTPQIDTFPNSEEERTITFEELKSILYKAYQYEKSNLVSLSYTGYESPDVTQTGVHYNDRYYCLTITHGENSSSVWIYSTEGYTHNYRFRIDGNNITYNGDYITDMINDQYIYTYGYGQNALHPNLFIPCYTKMFEKPSSEIKDSFVDMSIDGYVLKYTMKDYTPNIDMILESTFTKDYANVSTTITSPNNLTIKEPLVISSTYGERSNAPENVTTLIQNYIKENL